MQRGGRVMGGIRKEKEKMESSKAVFCADMTTWRKTFYYSALLCFLQESPSLTIKGKAEKGAARVLRIRLGNCYYSISPPSPASGSWLAVSIYLSISSGIRVLSHICCCANVSSLFCSVTFAYFLN